ncbi:phospholipase D family protein [Seohaeicola saemankumensis]|nr:phospholipase D family protein [Seohaeicola saemankumensis]MCA0872609.1 phospholipase D family protein [Seohaeicola saemankumensis]
MTQAPLCALYRLLCLAVLAGFSVLSACAPVPLDAAKPVTRAQTSPGPGELSLAARRAGDPGQSSFVVLATGNEALGARLRLIEAAQHTLDLQYFLMKPDLGGALISQALLAAADRGVRVRLLLDDVFTTVDDQALGLLAAHPAIELRIFNPAMRPGPKSLGFVTEFSRINRRMHNKTFTADGAFAIIGGRNIADEYFQIDTSSEFADFDMLVTGRAVAEISGAFDLFWNDGWSIPVERLRDPPSAAELETARRDLTMRLQPARRTYVDAINDPFFDRLRAGLVPVYSGPAHVATDRPDKLKVPVPEGERVLGETLLRRMKNARSEVILLTPYFVPEDYGARLFADLAARGVRVRIVTNSLGSTNHAYVHAGYRRHRVPLLEAGVELYEIRPDALRVLGLVPEGDETGLVMHTKLAVIDGRQVFVGSLNLDPRSLKQNTEFGLFIDSPPLARALVDALQDDFPLYTYRVATRPGGGLEWHYDNPAAPSVTTREPGATVWKNIVVGITELIGAELQL